MWRSNWNWSHCVSKYVIKHFGKRPRIQSGNQYFISIFWHWTQFWIFRKFKFDLLYILSLQKFDMFSWSRSNWKLKICEQWTRILVQNYFASAFAFYDSIKNECECDWICWKMVKVGQVLFLTLLRNALWLSVYSTLHMYRPQNRPFNVDSMVGWNERRNSDVKQSGWKIVSDFNLHYLLCNVNKEMDTGARECGFR